MCRVDVERVFVLKSIKNIFFFLNGKQNDKEVKQNVSSTLLVCSFYSGPSYFHVKKKRSEAKRDWGTLVG